MSESIYSEIENELRSLLPDKLKEVRDFIRFLLSQKRTKSDLTQLAGSIDTEDANLMRKSIADGCEKINYEQW